MGTVLLACSKSNSPETEPELPPEGAQVTFYKVHRVENLAAEADDKNPTVAKKAVFFSLETKLEMPLTYAKTARWDIALNGLYNSFFSGNNGANSQNSGTGGPGKGGILIVEKPFDEVVEIPAESQFKTGNILIGTDNAGAFGEGIGWYLYDFGGDVVGDASHDKMHVAYALGSALKLKDGTTVPARTMIVRTAKGNYAKIKMISCYKDAFTPDKWFRNTPHMYFTFEYVIVPAGSTKFEIK